MRNKNKIARTSLALEFATLTSAFILFFERAIEKTRTITGESHTRYTRVAEGCHLIILESVTDTIC